MAQAGSLAESGGAEHIWRKTLVPFAPKTTPIAVPVRASAPRDRETRPATCFYAAGGTLVHRLPHDALS